MTKQLNTYEIERTLVLSTGHITIHDNNLLKHNSDVMADEFSYTIRLGDPLDFWYTLLEFSNKGYSAALCNLLKLAGKLKCQYLKLDADGPLRDDLPQFKW